MAKPHFLLLTFPAQGHINPALQFAKRLARTGAQVTFATSLSAHRRMVKPAPFHGLFYACFSDGYDDGFKTGFHNSNDFMAQFKEVGSRNVSELVRNLAHEGRPVTCVIYTFLLPWASALASELSIPSVLLWIQPATVLAIYYHYFHGYEDVIKSNNKDPSSSSSMQLPGLPLLTAKDLPSFFTSSSDSPPIFPILDELFKELAKECNPKVLVNSFDVLEVDAMRSIDKLEMKGVGPLIPLAFLDPKETSDKEFGGDLFQNSRNYVEWLDSKPASSVVYVSFGSISVISEHQMEEILKGLLESGHPFLWVIRATENGAETSSDAEFWKKVKAAEEEKKQGLVVQWCSQVEVLSHPSVGCFISHCGWNSTLESLAVGVPIAGFPQWSDQPTNIKMVESVWKTGVRAKVKEDGVLEGEELKRCLDLVMGGEEGEEIKRNVAKWREMARESAAEGGSSDDNIRTFVDEMTGIMIKP